MRLRINSDILQFTILGTAKFIKLVGLRFSCDLAMITSGCSSYWFIFVENSFGFDSYSGEYISNIFYFSALVNVSEKRGVEFHH